MPLFDHMLTAALSVPHAGLQQQELEFFFSLIKFSLHVSLKKTKSCPKGKEWNRDGHGNEHTIHNGKDDK